jgi:hypothetical protein
MNVFFLLAMVNGLFRVQRSRTLLALSSSRSDYQFTQSRIVLYDQYGSDPRRRGSNLLDYRFASSLTRGKYSLKVAPLPGSLVTQI